MKRTMRKNKAKEFATINDQPSMTEQSHKKQCDINYILADYAKTGVLKHAHKNQGSYDDVSQMDFQKAVDLVADTRSMFEALPALTRAEFNNDVNQFLTEVRNPENGQRMQDLGILPGIDGVDSQGIQIEGMAELLEAIKPPTPEPAPEPTPDPGGESA